MNSNLMVVARPAGVYKGRAVNALVWLACPKMATQNCQPHDYLASGPERHWRVNPSPNHSERTRFNMADSIPKPILPLLEGKIGELRMLRFWSKVDMRGPDECWEWQGSRHGRGYGTFKIASYETVTASRLALVATKKEEPFGLLALHHCDNPPCCNPAHLYFGTVAQNAADKVSRGRARSGNQAGANNGAAKLTEDHVALIVDRLHNGWNNKQIAKDLPVSHSMISLIRLGKMWRSVTEALGYFPLPHPKRGGEV